MIVVIIKEPEMVRQPANVCGGPIAANSDFGARSVKAASDKKWGSLNKENR